MEIWKCWAATYHLTNSNSCYYEFVTLFDIWIEGKVSTIEEPVKLNVAFTISNDISQKI